MRKLSVFIFMLFWAPRLILAGELFEPSRHIELLNLISPADTNRVVEVLKQSGANWQELAGALQQVKPEYREGMVALISTLRSVDLFSCTSRGLLEEVEYAYQAKEEVSYKVPEDTFKEYVLPSRIHAEWFMAWRKKLYGKFHPMVKQARTVQETAKIVNRWVDKNIELKPMWVGRWPQAPVLTLRGKGGDQISVAVFTVAVLRSVGIPGRVATKIEFFGDFPCGVTWVEFFSGQKWLSLYPHDPAQFANFDKLSREYPKAIPLVYAGGRRRWEDVTASYTSIGTLKVVMAVPDSGGKSIDFSVGAFSDGSWRTVTDHMGLSFTADSTGAFQMKLGIGDYLAEAEIDKYVIFLKRFSIEKDKTTYIEIKPKSWEYTKDIYDSYR